MKWQKVSFNLRSDTEPMDLMQRILNSLPAFSEIHGFTVEGVTRQEPQEPQTPHPHVSWAVVAAIFFAGFMVGSVLGAIFR